MGLSSDQLARACALSLAVLLAGVATPASAQRCTPAPCSVIALPTPDVPALAVAGSALAVAGGDLLGSVSGSGVLGRLASPEPEAVGVASGSDAAVWIVGHDSVTRVAREGTTMRAPLSSIREEWLLGVRGLVVKKTRIEHVAQGPIVVASDNTAWLADDEGIVRVGLDGVRSLVRPTSTVEGLTAGAHGTVWATVREPVNASGHSSGLKVIRLSPDGAWHEWPLPRAFEPRYESHLGGLAVAPDGSVWFAAQTAGVLGRIGSEGALSAVDVDGYPTDVAPGPGNTIWFSSWNGIDRGWVGRMTPGGFFTLFDQPSAPQHIAVSGSTVWTALHGGVGRISTFDGVVVTRRRVAHLTHTGGTVYPRVFCPSFTQGYCAGRLRLSVGGRTIGSAPFAVRPNDGPSVRVSLSRVARAVVARRGRLRVRVDAKSRDGAGQVRNTSGTVTVLPA